MNALKTPICGHACIIEEISLYHRAETYLTQTVVYFLSLTKTKYHAKKQIQHALQQHL